MYYRSCPLANLKRRTMSLKQLGDLANLKGHEPWKTTEINEWRSPRWCRHCRLRPSPSSRRVPWSMPMDKNKATEFAQISSKRVLVETLTHLPTEFIIIIVSIQQCPVLSSPLILHTLVSPSPEEAIPLVVNCGNGWGLSTKGNIPVPDWLMEREVLFGSPVIDGYRTRNGHGPI